LLYPDVKRPIERQREPCPDKLDATSPDIKTEFTKEEYGSGKVKEADPEDEVDLEDERLRPEPSKRPFFRRRLSWLSRWIFFCQRSPRTHDPSFMGVTLTRWTNNRLSLVEIPCPLRDIQVFKMAQHILVEIPRSSVDTQVLRMDTQGGLFFCWRPPKYSSRTLHRQLLFCGRPSKYSRRRWTVKPDLSFRTWSSY
jgi:hypothetical protein